MKTLVILTFLKILWTVKAESGDPDHENEGENTIIRDIPNLITSNRTIEIRPGSDLELVCQFNRELASELMVLWEFQGTSGTKKMYSMGTIKVYNKRKFTLEQLTDGKSGMKITIPDVSPEDAGIYQCMINDKNPQIAIHTVKIVESSKASNVVITAFLFYLCLYFSVNHYFQI